MRTGFPELQHRAMITRDAHTALRELKTLVDAATEKIHAAELETIALAIAGDQESASPETAKAASEMLRSPRFQATLQRALTKMEMAVSWNFAKVKAASR